jgi:serine phosphatase RsbU (regulator of sigma subunit)
VANEADQSRTKARLLDLFAEVSRTVEPHTLGPLTAEAVEVVGGRHGALYLVDLEQQDLIPVGDDFSGEKLSIDGSIAGRAFRSAEQLAVAQDDGSTRLWIPLIDGANRIGVIGATQDTLTDEHRATYADLAHLVASLVVSKSQIGDSLNVVRRTRDVDLAAELRWSLLPPLTAASPHVSIAAILEPAYQIAGDAFDYAVNPGIAHIAVFDAVGHGLEASRLANLAVGSYRHSRRRGLDLAATYQEMDHVVAAQFGESKFVTAQFAQLDVACGRLRWLDAGHPKPLRLRNGAVSQLDGDVCLPVGLGSMGPDKGATHTADTCEASLEPGDGVLFFSDGVTEARSPTGELFGVDRLGEFLVRAASAGEALPETVRRLARAVLAHQQDHLQDDASIVLMNWHPDNRC